jgi:hypothetical protein
LLVERVDISGDGADIRLRTDGLLSLVADMGRVAAKPATRKAA